MACDQKIILFLEIVVVQRFLYNGRQWLFGRTTGSFRNDLGVPVIRHAVRA
jgi:hypothetical protein